MPCAHECRNPHGCVETALASVLCQCLCQCLSFWGRLFAAVSLNLHTEQMRGCTWNPHSHQAKVSRTRKRQVSRGHQLHNYTVFQNRWDHWNLSGTQCHLVEVIDIFFSVTLKKVLKFLHTSIHPRSKYTWVFEKSQCLCLRAPVTSPALYLMSHANPTRGVTPISQLNWGSVGQELVYLDRWADACFSEDWNASRVDRCVRSLINLFIPYSLPWHSANYAVPN